MLISASPPNPGIKNHSPAVQSLPHVPNVGRLVAEVLRVAQDKHPTDEHRASTQVPF